MIWHKSSLSYTFIFAQSISQSSYSYLGLDYRATLGFLVDLGSGPLQALISPHDATEISLSGVLGLLSIVYISLLTLFIENK